MSLETTINEIKAVNVHANAEVTDQPLETLPGRRARKKAAQERLKSLTETYRQELLNSSMFILVVGNERTEFVEKATGFGVFAADTDSFYKDLAARIPETLFMGKESSANLFDVISRHLEDKAMELGMLAYPQLIFKQEYRGLISTREDLTRVIKRAISTQVGAEVSGIQAVKSITTKAIELGHSSRITPIMLAVDDEASVSSLMSGLLRLTRLVFVVGAGETSVTNALIVEKVTSGTVTKAMKVLRAGMNGRRITMDDVADEPVVESVSGSIEVTPLPGESLEQTETRVVDEIMSGTFVKETVVESVVPTTTNTRSRKNK